MEMHVRPAARVTRGTLILVSITASALLLGLTAGSAAAADFDPEAFEVEVEMGPGEDDFTEPDCVPAGEGRMRCTMDMSFSEVAAPKQGTVRHLSSGLSGVIDMVCDLAMDQHMVMVMASNGEQTLEEFSGEGHMACNWFMDFEGDTTLSGVIHGDMEMHAVDYEQGIVAFTGTMTVNVVAGTGEFADAYGGGSFTEHDEFSVFGGGPDGGPGGDHPGDGPQAARGALAARQAPDASEDGAMNLRLKKGRARTRIVSPAKVLQRGDRDTRLRVATARKARCTASATDGDERVKLGRARDADGNSDVTFRAPLARELDPGKWKVSVACDYPSGGKTQRAAPASQTFRIA